MKKERYLYINLALLEPEESNLRAKRKLKKKEPL